MGDYRNARASLLEALRDFRWLEYRPFVWIMLAELLFAYLISAYARVESFLFAVAGSLLTAHVPGDQPQVHDE